MICALVASAVGSDSPIPLVASSVLMCLILWVLFLDGASWLESQGWSSAAWIMMLAPVVVCALALAYFVSGW